MRGHKVTFLCVFSPHRRKIFTQGWLSGSFLKSSIRGNKAIDIIVTSLPWKFHARPFCNHSRLALFFSSNAYSNILLCPGCMSEWLTSGRRLGFLNARKIDHGYSGFVKLQNGKTEIDTRNNLNGLDFKHLTWLLDHTKVCFWCLEVVIVMNEKGNFHAGELLEQLMLKFARYSRSSSRLRAYNFQLPAYNSFQTNFRTWVRMFP